MEHQAPGHGARLTGDTGAALVEAAFVTPVLMFLLLGIFETSFSFLDYLTTGNASRNGIRTAAIAGKDGLADYQIVQSVVKSAAAMKKGDLTRIVVYEATGVGSTVPAGCAAGTPSTTAGARCNVYSGSDFTATQSSTIFGCTAAAKDRYFCPSTMRKTALQGSNGPPGWIGVYVVSTHQYLTKMFGTSLVMQADTVSRFEPDSLQ